MTKKLWHIVFALAVVVIMAAACHRRPLEDASELVRIRVDVNVRAITNITNRTRYTNNPRIDEITKEKEDQLNTDVMRCLVYNPATGTLSNQSFLTSKSYDENGDQVFSGNLNISFGDFDFLLYNFDTPTTQVKGENREDKILAYTNPLPPSQRAAVLGTKSDDYDNVSINYEPEHLMVARKFNTRVSPHDTLVVIRTEAQSIIDTYYIQIHVEGMQYATTRATAVITGLAPSNAFGLGVRTDDPTAAVCFDLRQSTDVTIEGDNKDVMCAVFNTFGKIEDVSSTLRVTFNVVDVSGKLQQKDVNLDKIFKTKEAIENHWLLIDETWVIEKPDFPTPTGGGFQPVVGEWEETEGSISL